MIGLRVQVSQSLRSEFVTTRNGADAPFPNQDKTYITLKRMSDMNAGLSFRLCRSMVMGPYSWHWVRKITPHKSLLILDSHRKKFKTKIYIISISGHALTHHSPC